MVLSMLDKMAFHYNGRINSRFRLYYRFYNFISGFIYRRSELMIARRDGDNLGLLFTAISCSCDNDIGLGIPVTESRLGTCKDWHFRLPEIQGRFTIISCVKRSRKFCYEFTYLNSSQITMLIKLATQLLPTWTVKDKPYIWNFPLYSSSGDHTFIIVTPFEHRKMPVERKHKFRRNILSKHLSQFHCSNWTGYGTKYAQKRIRIPENTLRTRSRRRQSERY